MKQKTFSIVFEGLSYNENSNPALTPVASNL